MSLINKNFGISSFALAGLVALGLSVPVTVSAADEVESIVVVGSRIPTTAPLDGAAPVQIVSSESIRASGLTNLGDLLQELPGAGSALNLLYNNGGDGSVRLDFRNLGTARTLVLVDGRRWIPGGEGANGSSDLNTIPIGLVERIEILKDGASSVYGSDAMGAVVNIVTKDEYDGARFEYTTGGYEDGGAERKRAEALFGVDGERGNVTLGMTWVDSKELSNADRVQTAARPQGGGSSGTPQARFAYSLRLDAARETTDYRADFITGNTAGTDTQSTRNVAHPGWTNRTSETNFVNAMNPAVATLYSADGNNVALEAFAEFNEGNSTNFTVQEGSQSALTGASPTDFRVRVGGDNGDGFNYNPYNYVLTPNERRSIFLNSRFDLTDRVSAVAKVVYQNRRSDQLLAPTPLFWGFGTNEGISANNAFNTLGVEFCGLDGNNLDGESCYGDRADTYYYYTGAGRTATDRLPDYLQAGEVFYNATVINNELNDDGVAINPDGKVTAWVDLVRGVDDSADDRTDTDPDDYSGAYTSTAGVITTDPDTNVSTGGSAIYYIGTDPTDAADATKDDLYLWDSSGTRVAANTDYVANLTQRQNVTGSGLFENITGDQILKDGHAGGWFGRRLLEYGTRNFIQNIETFHAEIGLDGEFQMAAGNWAWDVRYSWSQNQASIRTDGLINTNRLANALGASAENSAYEADADTNNDRMVDAAEATAYNTANAGVDFTDIVAADRFELDANGNVACVRDAGNGCVSLNVFGGQGIDSVYLGNGLWGGSGSMTQQMLDYVGFVAQDTGGNYQKLLTANMFGDVVQLPAGPLAVALGYEQRTTSAFDQPDALIATNQTSGNARTPTRGAYDVKEYYLEAKIPLVSGLPGVHDLEFTASVRSSDFSTFGSTTTDKFAIRWAFTDKIIFRGSVSTGYRAPGIGELFRGRSDSYPEISDPCAEFVQSAPNAENFVGADNFSICAQEGGRLGFDQPNGQIRITVGGNPNLQPETSTTQTWGFVIKPSDSMQIYLDVWSIEIDDAISGLGAQTILNRCYNPDQIGHSLVYCDLVDRASDGSVSDLRSFSLNLVGLETEGADLAFVYDPSDAWRLVFDTTYVDHNTNIDSLGGRANFVGTADGRGVTPRVKARLYTRWSNDNWRVTVEENYIHGVISAVDADERYLPGRGYLDIQTSYYYEPWRTSVSLNLDNLLDQDPPYHPDAFANDFNADYRFWGSRGWQLRFVTSF